MGMVGAQYFEKFMDFGCNASTLKRIVPKMTFFGHDGACQQPANTRNLALPSESGESDSSDSESENA